MTLTLKSFFSRYVRWVTRFDWLICAGSIVLSVLFFFPTFNLYTHISTTLRALLPDDYPSVRVLDRAGTLFKSRTNLAFTFEITQSTPESLIVLLARLKTYFEQDPRVGEISYERDAFDYFDKRKWLYMEIDELRDLKSRIERRIQREKLGGFYIDFEDQDTSKEEDENRFADLAHKYGGDFEGKYRRYFASKDNRLFSFYLYPKDENLGLGAQEAFMKEMIVKMNAFPWQHDVPDLKIYVAGSIKTKVDEYEALIQDLSKAGIVSFVLICIVLFVYFRRLWVVLLLNGMLLQSVIWTFAFVSLFIHELNIITSFLFSILFGLGIDIGIHLLARYREERLLGKPCIESLQIMLETIVKPSLFAVGSTAFSFFLLMINDFRGFSEFGFIAGVGLLFSIGLYVLFLPSYVHLLERIRLFHWSKKTKVDAKVKTTVVATAGLEQRHYPRPRLVLAVSGIIVFLICLGIPQLNFEYDFKKIKAYVGEAQAAKSKFRETLTSISNPAVVLFNTELQGAAIQKTVLEQKHKLGETSIIDGFRWYADLVPSHQEEKLEIVKEIIRLLDDDALNLVKGENRKRLEDFRYELKRGLNTYVIPEELPPSVVKRFFASDGSGTQIGFIQPLKNVELDDGRNAIRFRNEVHTLHTDEGTVHASSDAIVFAEVLLTLMRDSRVAVVLSIVSVVLLVWWDVKSLRLALFLLTPLMCGVFLMSGIMGWLGLSLNFYNIVVFPAIFGMGEDTSIYFYHRFLEERAIAPKGAVMRMLKTAGAATALSMLTTVFGFFGLALAQHQGLQSIGIAAIIGLLACYLASILPFAAGLELLGRRLDKKQMLDIVSS